MRENKNTSKSAAGFSCEFRNAVEYITSIISTDRVYAEQIHGMA